MQRITYKDLVDRYGNTVAFDLLLSVEKLAKIQNEMISLEEEDRFQVALDALNEIDFAANI